MADRGTEESQGRASSSRISATLPESHEYNLAVAAVQKDDVDALQELIDRCDVAMLHSLLNMAIHHRREKVCDYLLTLNALTADDQKSRSRLRLCLKSNSRFHDNIACKLVKKGVQMDVSDLPDGDTFLHHAIDCGYPELSKLLMEMGHDVNALNRKGETPLATCLRACRVVPSTVEQRIINFGCDLTLSNQWALVHVIPVFGREDSFESEMWRSLRSSDYLPREETIPALLYYGADPCLGRICGYKPFEYAVMKYPFTLPSMETLFLYIFDKHTSIKINIEVLLVLAYRWPPYFYSVIDCVDIVMVNETTCLCHRLLFFIDVTCLAVLVKKFPEVVKLLLVDLVEFCHRRLSMGMGDFNMRHKWFSKANIAFLFESELRDDITNLVVRLNSPDYTADTTNYFNKSTLTRANRVVVPREESTVIKNLSFLLSYGFRLTDELVHQLYKTYGFGALMKMLLFMDIGSPPVFPYPPNVYLWFLCDVNLDIDEFLDHRPYCNYPDIEKLIHYFARPRLRAMIEDTSDALLEQSNVPLLQELARDACRRHIVRVFNIQNCAQFHTIVNALPIAPTHKDILTLIKPLYC